MSRIKLMNTEIDNLSMNEAIDEIDKLINLRHKYVVTPNVDHIVKLENDAEFRAVYENADLILADGKPLIWISKLYGTPIKEKISGSDIFPKICKLANKRNYSMYLLGAGKGVAEVAAKKIDEEYNNVRILGTYSPPFGFENDSHEVGCILERINNVKPDILIVGLGAPKQEKFIYNYIEKLDVGIALGLGASIDFMAGNVKRAPKWVSNAGLEWFYRFLQEPKRLFKRYFIDDVQIIKLFFKYGKSNDKS